MVSVLVLSWNHERYIEQSLASVIQQSYQDIEIIYLDNNSADNTFLIAEKILRSSCIKYKAFKNRENKNITSNFNFLFSESHGEFVCLQSGDDWLHKNSIEEKLRVFDENKDVGMVYSTGYKYHEAVDAYELVPPVFVKKKDALTELLMKNFISVTGCIIKSDVIRAVGGWDDSLLIEDGDMWIKIAKQYEIKLVDKPLFFYRQHAGAVSRDPEFIYKGKMEWYEKYKHINPNRKITLRNIQQNYLSNLVMNKSSFSIILKILKSYKPDKFYTTLLIKSLIPLAIRKKYYLRSLRRKNPDKPIT